MAQRKNTAPQLPFAPIAVAAGVVGLGAATWFGYPGVVALWLGLVVAAWVAEPGILTGKKDAYGYPTAANPAEQISRQHWLMWRELRTGLIVPSADWMPGYPVLESWIAAALAAGLGYLVPVIGVKSLPAASGHLLNALAAFIIVVEVASVTRHAGAGNHPGTRTDTLGETVADSPNVVVASAVVGALLGLVLAGVAINVVAKYGTGFGAPSLVHHPAPGLHHRPHPGIKIAAPGLLWPLLGVLGAMVAITGHWRRTALTRWREVTEANGIWRPRWESLKFDPAPALVGHRVVGPATVDTFDAPPNLGAMAFWPLGPKLAPTLGAGMKVAVLESPDINADGLVPGSHHPLRFEVVSWPLAAIPNLAATDTDPDLAGLLAHSAMVWALEPRGYGRPVPLAVGEITAPDSPVKVWRSQWAWPAGPNLEAVRCLTGDMETAFGTKVAIDHRETSSLYFGAIGDESAIFETESGTDWADLFAHLALEDRWTGIWENVSKQSANPPTIQHQVSAEKPLSNGVVVKRLAFATRLGVEPGEYQGLEKKLATSLDSAPFVAVTGWVTSGERHPQAFAVYWASAAVPASPDLLSPSPAAQWVLAGQVNAAFDDSKLARPEIIDARPLTDDDAPAHLWEIDLRLYDGVTSSDVRSRADRIRKALRVPWLRVTDAPNGCVLFAGAAPADARLKSTDRDALRLVSLDWERAWQDSGVTGTTGSVPELTVTGTLPSNPQVEVLDFALPAGADRTKVRMGLSKLGAATGNSFIELRDSPEGASSIRLLVSRESPLPDLVPFDFDAAGRADGIACATGIEGEPVVFDPKLDPHLLVAGLSGGGKAEKLTNPVPVPVSDKFPTGWGTIGELAVGNVIFTPDGSTANVVGLSPVEMKPVFEVAFSDGQVVECSPDHLWKVSSSASRALRTPAMSGRREARLELYGTRADELRQLALRIGSGVVAPLSEISRLAGVHFFLMHRVVPKALSTRAVVDIKKAASQFDMDAVIAYVHRAAKVRGEFQFCGQRFSATRVRSLIGGRWLTTRQMTDTLLGRPGSRNERDLAKQIVRRSAADRRPHTEQRDMSVYPVDEVLTVLAERIEDQAGRSDSGRAVPPLESIVTTEAMSNQVFNSRGASNWAVRSAEPIAGEEVDLPLDPYVLGAWLGDGTSSGGQITQGESEACTDKYGLTDQEFMIEQLVLAGVDASASPSTRAVISTRGLKVALRQAGVLKNKHIPPAYLRASYRQRLALLQGIMDTDGTVDKHGSCELCLCDERLITGALELIRSFGIKAAISSGPSIITEPDPERPGHKRRRVTGTRWRIHFTTTLPVFRLPRKAERIHSTVRKTQELVYITDIRQTGRIEPMRCIVVDHPEHLYLTGQFIPTHNSVLAQGILYGAATSGADLYIIDPVKGAADFKFAAPYAKAIATNPAEAAAAMKAVYAEVVRRKNVNSAAGVGSFRELEDPPPIMVVLIDEFSSLIGKSIVPKPSEDLVMEAEREAIIADNLARQEIGVFAGKIAREARSAGAVLVLCTQRLDAKMLDSIPGASDLRTNLSRMLIGKASSGDRLVALRSPDDAPDLGDNIPRGRGIWETTAGSGVVVQCWYAPQSELAEQLQARMPALGPDQKTDLRPFLPKPTFAELHGNPPLGEVAPEPELVDLGELEFSLDDLEPEGFPEHSPDNPDNSDDSPDGPPPPAETIPSPEPAGASQALADKVDWNQDWGDSAAGPQPVPVPMAVPEAAATVLVAPPAIEDDDPFAPLLPVPVTTPAPSDPDDPFA